MRRPALDDEVEVAASRPGAGERTVRQGRGLIGEGRALALRRLREQCRGGGRADFLVAVDHDFIADTVGDLAVLDRCQRGEHHRKAAFHVGDAGSAKHAVRDPARLLERVVGGIDGVHVPGQQQLHGRRRPHCQVQMSAVLDLEATPGAVD